MKEEIKKAIESVIDDNENWYHSKRQGTDVFDIGKALPLMVEAVAKVISSNPPVMQSLASEQEIDLEDVIAWADGIDGAFGTEYAGRITEDEAIIAKAINDAKKRADVA